MIPGCAFLEQFTKCHYLCFIVYFLQRCKNQPLVVIGLLSKEYNKAYLPHCIF